MSSSDRDQRLPEQSARANAQQASGSHYTGSPAKVTGMAEADKDTASSAGGLQLPAVPSSGLVQFISRFGILQRALSMSLVFLLILLTGFAFTLLAVDDMQATASKAGVAVDEQTRALAEQRLQLAEQAGRREVQTLVFDAYAAYNHFIYWRFDSVVTKDENSIRESDKAEARLRARLAEIAGKDAEVAEAAEVVEIYLDDFKAPMDQAWLLAQQDASAFEIRSQVGRAQSQSMAINSMFEGLLQTAGDAVARAGLEVQEIGNRLAETAATVDDAKQSVIRQTEGLTRAVWGILAVSVVITLLSGILLALSITRPVSRFNRVIREIARDADLGRRLKYLKDNEIGDIARALNQMFSKFQGSLLRLADAGRRLGETAESSAHASRAARETSDQLNTEVASVATASNQMAVTVRGIGEHTEQALARVDEAVAACESGRTIVNETTRQIESLAGGIFENANRVRTLSENSEQIGSVLEVIRTIAEQTNLLALNAAIEAARAGDQGRGFAVVADEVRALAHKTQSSTEEIQNMIGRLQGGTEAAVRGITQARTEAERTLEQARRTNTAIDTILGAVQVITDTNRQINEATREQALAAHSIDESLSRISQLSGVLSETAETTAATSQNLSAMVAELNHIVEGFKLD